MKLAGTAILALVTAATACAQGGTGSMGALSPAQQKIAAATKMIEAAPQRFQNYNQLAMALARRARETAEVSLYAQADGVLDKSFAISPGNLEGQKVKAWILLGKHEYQEALAIATSANKLWPDDVVVYGYIADAQIALGNYSAAEEAAQWMLDIRPGNVPGMQRGADLREIYGDIDGASEMLNSALVQTAPNETADRSWLLTRLGHLQLMAGHLAEADKYLQQAQAAFPNYHYTLEILAELRRAQGQYAEAAELLGQRYQLAPLADHAYSLAVALDREGQHKYADLMYAEFEQKARREIDQPDNANPELIFFYTDHAGKPAEALRIATIEFSKHQDVYTRDAYAWALAANGQAAEARTQIEAALAVGIRDSQLFFHAGSIAMQGNDARSAVLYFKKALDLNPVSEYAAAARRALEKLRATSAMVGTSN
jgi:tetratricopeptide (TPR) repeat protein